jgi:hypothetical protein
MVKVMFMTSTKYKGVRYDAHTPFEADEADMEQLQRDGAIIVSRRTEAVLKEKKVKKTKDKTDVININ